MEDKKCIVIGITGGIAAYKVCTLISSLRKKGFDVHVIPTRAALQFITPLTLQTLSGNKVITDMFTVDYTPDVHHVSLAVKADLFVVAPATANTIAKIANGVADNMLTTTFLAAPCKKLIVPAMNNHMYENQATQDNLERCKQLGMEILGPNSGYLACGSNSKGRMVEAEEIEDKIFEMFEQDKFMKGKKVLITGGPTREAIDPVRYITNHSTGTMGVALARAARNYGADVTYVSGMVETPELRDIDVVSVVSADDMQREVLKRSDDMDVMILAAAVADFTPVHTADEKIHKKDEGMELQLTKTIDILKTIGTRKKKDQVIVGFSMETENLIENSLKKLKKKNCDYIIANSLRETGAGFGKKTNIVTIISEDSQETLGLLSKDETAKRILQAIFGKEL